MNDKRNNKTNHLHSLFREQIHAKGIFLNRMISSQIIPNKSGEALHNLVIR